MLGVFTFDLGVNFSSSSNGFESIETSQLDVRAFFGASLNPNGVLFFGQNVMQTNRTVEAGGQSYELSVLELGPKVMLFFGANSPIYLAVAWNPFLSGDRANLDGTTEDVSGSSILGSLGAQIKVTKTFRFGASFNYHSISITEATDSDNLESDVSQSFTDIYPMIEMAFQFK